MSDFEELISKIKDKDIEAFEKLVLSVERDLYRIAQTRLDNVEDIEDAIQETMIVAFNSIEDLNSFQYFRAWIIKILINECNHIYKKNNRFSRLHKKLSLDKEEYNYGEIYELEHKIELEKVLSFLNYDDRLCITLFYNEHYSINEIAQILDENANTVKSRITRAKKKIRKYYDGGVESEKRK
mgnify:CR=1 FL=1